MLTNATHVRATSVFTGLQLGCLMNLLIWGTSAFLRAAPGELAWLAASTAAADAARATMRAPLPTDQ